jgi:ATP/ADP translocase
MTALRSTSGSGSGARVPGAGLAVATALAMIAYQVGAKATRDALFLSSYSISSLPAMTIASAIFSIAMAFGAARLLTRFGPERAIPFGFIASALLLLVEWAAVVPWPRATAVAVYLHYGGLGALLISGFWTLLNERFDPRTAKRTIGRVAAGGTVGGLLGGILAERIGSASSVATMLPVLALLHAACAVFVWRFRNSAPPIVERTPEAERGTRAMVDSPLSGGAETASASGLRVLAGSPYLRTLVGLVLLVTMSEGLIDWVFKASAAASMVQGQELLRLFAAFYTGVSLLTVVVQAALSRVALERLGLARSVATLPAVVGIGSIGALLWPGLPSALGLRAGESILRSSLYRAGYETLFTPLAPREKRAVKTIVDVGAVRSGDFLGAGLVQAVLVFIGVAAAPAVLLWLTIAASGAAIIVALRLHAGYVRTLERGLLSRAVHLDLSEVHDAATRSIVLQSLGGTALSQVLDRSSIAGLAAARAATVGERAATATSPKSPDAPLDPVAARARALASGRRDEVQRALHDGPLPPALLAQSVALLAWDDVAKDVIGALRSLGAEAVPPLVGALTDPECDFAIRRRVPLILGTVADAPAVEGLLGGLTDRRFEVRYRCGRALSHLLEYHPRLGVPPDRVYDAVLREVRLERRVWDSQRVLDQWDDDMWSPVADDALRARANRSLEHVFTLLALALPRQPLRIAFRGLHTDDPLLRGTALEYLETSLPAEIRKELWTYLEDDRKRGPETRSRDSVLADLLRSNESIVIRLDELRRSTPEDDRP